MLDTPQWYREYDLELARKHPSKRNEAVHQTEALSNLRKWYEDDNASGGLLVLPTGAGKTFTTVRFLCRHPLSDDYKVLWLAHTHHLLEQALDSFGRAGDLAEVGLIHGDRKQLRVRVVSGTVGHHRPADIETTDDILICTLQTARNAYLRNHEEFHAFLKSAKGKLLVVFDEAHHAPAPSYCELVLGLRKHIKGMKLLGLTATPMYGSPGREGWLSELFPEKILYQVSASQLIALKILARPIVHSCDTRFTPMVDPVQFKKWRASHQDIPEDIITKLAQDQQRNDTIWKKYVDNQTSFGKTLIFADRWYQCDYLREKLLATGVRADVVYSHVEADPGSAEARARRARDENAAVLQRFRDGQLDVLINVRMLTEGTDVPNVQTVFVTRQTTSQILLRQMIGRALRGTKFGGTDSANIVLFMDDWREAIQWAEFEGAWGTEKDGERGRGGHRPYHLVSVELVRRLARDMESGQIAPTSFLSLLPVGWYMLEFDVQSTDDDIDHVRPMVLVYEDEREGYASFLQSLTTTDLGGLAHQAAARSAYEELMTEWRLLHFPQGTHSSALSSHLFDIARHVAQSGGQAPCFFTFEQRQDHDLTPHAKMAAKEDWGLRKIWQLADALYSDKSLFWPHFYPSLSLFRQQLEALVKGEIERLTGMGTLPPPSIVVPPPPPNVTFLSDEVRKEVLTRDGACLCCGQTKKLQVDHILSKYNGGKDDPKNLQTLCATCNNAKSHDLMIDFQNTQTTLKSARPFSLPHGFNSSDLSVLERDIRRTINFFYGCAAVDEVEIMKKGIKRREWRIRLRANNPRDWLHENLPLLFERIRKAQSEAGDILLRSLTLEANDGSNEVSRAYCDHERDFTRLKPDEITSRKKVALYHPTHPGLPNSPMTAKVIRADTTKKVVELRAFIGNSELELSAPLKVVFDWHQLPSEPGELPCDDSCKLVVKRLTPQS